MAKKKKKVHDSRRLSSSEFLRCCINCSQRIHCEKKPPRHSMRLWKEWCPQFDPNYRLIDKKRWGGGIKANDSSVSNTKRAARRNTLKNLQETADLIACVEEGLGKEK